MDFSEKYIKYLIKGLEDSKFSINNFNTDLNDFLDAIKKEAVRVKKENSRIFFLGNGASASFSNHMALDWSKNGKIPSFCLSDSALLTALSNDYDYSSAMLEYLKIYGIDNKDLVVTTSSSGNSKNIINVLEYCKENQIKTVAFSGLKNDNTSRKLGYYSLYVPLKTYGLVECIHQIFHHLWLDKYMDVREWDKIESQNMDSQNFRL